MSTAQPNFYIDDSGEIYSTMLYFENSQLSWIKRPVNFDFMKIIESGKFPRSDCDSFIGVEDLGRGSTGKAWLTTTKACAAVCVIKFYNQSKCNIQHELNCWHTAYEEFTQLVSIKTLVGQETLQMPHFSTIIEADRMKFKNDIKIILENNFHSKSLVHTDVRWRNIGCYKNKMNEIKPIVYDLYDVRTYDQSKDFNWINIAISILYPDPVERLEGSLSRLSLLSDFSEIK